MLFCVSVWFIGLPLFSPGRRRLPKIAFTKIAEDGLAEDCRRFTVSVCLAEDCLYGRRALTLLESECPFVLVRAVSPSFPSRFAPPSLDFTVFCSTLSIPEGPSTDGRLFRVALCVFSDAHFGPVGQHAIDRLLTFV